MSSDSPSPLRPPIRITPTVKIALMAWVVLGIGAYVLSSINSAPTKVHDDDGKSIDGAAIRPDSSDSGRSELLVELEAAREESRQLAERLNRLETGVDTAPVNKRQSSTAKSEQAVQKARLVALTAEVNSVTADLGKLKKLQSEWTALEAKLLNGEAGRRISGSPQHLQLVIDLWQRERPSSDSIVQWESELSALSESIIDPTAEQTTIEITE